MANDAIRTAPAGNTPPGPPLACEIRACRDPAREWQHGRYCVRHARKAAPRVQWEALGIPAAGAAAA